MTKQKTYYRFRIVHGDDADFVAYQRKLDEDAWQTVSVWMLPQVMC